MMIELLSRYVLPTALMSNEQVEGLLETQRIIQGDSFDEDDERERIMKELGIATKLFEYGRFAFNLKDVVAFNEVDEQHTAVRFFNNAINVFQIKYEDFKEIFIQELGVVIKEIIPDEQ